jgi:hypothetical protein
MPAPYAAKVASTKGLGKQIGEERRKVLAALELDETRSSA